MEKYAHPERIYHYTYLSQNRSLITPILSIFWNFAFRCVPKNISANFLSIIGNIGSWLTLFLLMFFGSSHGREHPWIFLLASIGICFYHTVDSIDGKQARRLGIAGPLGEFIDHWFDSFNIFILPLGIIFAFPNISMFWPVLIITLAVLADYIVMYEVFKTNVMFFDFLSTQEGITMVWIFYFIVFLTGYGFWIDPHPVLGFAPIYFIAVFSALGFAATILKTLIKLQFSGIKGLFMELICLIPIIFWMYTASLSFDLQWVLPLGLFTMGFTCSRYVGDVLRARLVGLHNPLIYPDFVFLLSIILAVSIVNHFITPLHEVILFTPLIIMLGNALRSLVIQFLMTVKRVRDCLGITLFGIVPAEKGKNKLLASENQLFKLP